MASKETKGTEKSGVKPKAKKPAGQKPQTPKPVEAQKTERKKKAGSTPEVAQKPVPDEKQAAPVPMQVVPVPESILKHKKSLEELEAERRIKKKEQKKKNKTTRRDVYKRAEKYAAEYRAKEKHEVRMKRIAKNSGNFYVGDEPRLALVVRIRGINGVSPKVRKILRLLRLRQLQNAVFVRLNKPTLQMLQLVDPFIAYGYPSLKTIKELIYKRGYAKINGQRIALTDNQIIESKLRPFNVICVEDIIHEIFTVGPNFKSVNNFLWPFKLNSPRGGFVRKLNHFCEGGDAGNREQYINQLIARMN